MRVEIGLISTLNDCKLFFLADIKVVPLPENGSKTFPLILNLSIKKSTSLTEKPSLYGYHLWIGVLAAN